MNNLRNPKGWIFEDEPETSSAKPLKMAPISDCFGSLVYAKIVGLNNAALRQVIVQIGSLAWNIASSQDRALRAERLAAAKLKSGAILGAGVNTFTNLLDELVELKEKCFPWIAVDIKVDDFKNTEDAISFNVATPSSSRRVALLSNAPIACLESFSLAIDEIFNCTSVQSPILSRLMRIPGGISDVDRTKISSIYSCQAANLLAYKRIAESWLDSSPSDHNAEIINVVLNNIGSAQTDTDKLLAVLLS